MPSTPQSTYLKTQIETATPGKLILMIYDGAIGNLRRALESLRRGDMEYKGEQLIRTQDFITELMCSLNFEAGKIAHSLYALYDYMNRRLTMANARRDMEAIQEVIELLCILRAGWAKMVVAEGMEASS